MKSGTGTEKISGFPCQKKVNRFNGIGLKSHNIFLQSLICIRWHQMISLFNPMQTIIKTTHLYLVNELGF